MTPTEHEMTVAVHAAGSRLWERITREGDDHTPFEDLPPLTRNALLEEVLKLVVAALEALPDRAAAERIRIGTYLTDNMWCHHDGCDQDPCSCGLDALLSELQEVPCG